MHCVSSAAQRAKASDCWENWPSTRFHCETIASPRPSNSNDRRMLAPRADGEWGPEILSLRAESAGKTAIAIIAITAMTIGFVRAKKISPLP